MGVPSANSIQGFGVCGFVLKEECGWHRKCRARDEEDFQPFVHAGLK